MSLKDEKTADNTKRAVLMTQAPNQPQEMIKLRRDATIFGRDKGDIIVEDSEVSSSHCQIQNIGEVYHIFDMNSTNGTFVNSQRIVKAKLKEGDIVTIGKTSFRFSLEDERSVRHLATIFRTKKGNKERNQSVVDTLIQSELRGSVGTTLVIQVRYPSGNEEIIELKQKMVYIGRASSFGHFDEDTEISRKHILIKLNDSGDVFAEDQGSTNGSFLNDQKLSGMHHVNPTDEIRIGGCTMRVSVK